MKEEAKNVLSRLALVIHWAGFMLGLMLSLLMIMMVFQQPLVIFVVPFIFLFFAGFGWLIRFILVGKIPFLPYKKN
jgi:hypothetical protein|tara:strand:- start:35 stop:262 length:228 start_codon:yes stop_codon:yes gene_type:complete